MNKIFKVKKITGFRSFKSKNNRSNDETVDVVGLILQDGANEIYCEAYRDEHDVVQKTPIVEGDLVGARLTS